MGSGFTSARDAPLIAEQAAQLGVLCARDVAAALAQYVEQVALWNRQIDLTAAKDAPGQVEVLLADAFVLAGSPALPQGARLVDVGSGAGAPALPLLIMRPDLAGVLIEPLHKRVAFLRTAIGRLGLADRAQVLERRVEGVSDRFDVALSRATFGPAEWLGVGARLSDAVVVFTAGACDEVLEGHDPVFRRSYRLPVSGSPREITLYRACARG